MTQAKANIPANYSRLIARELGLSVKQLPLLLAGTGLRTEQLLREDTTLTPAQQIQIFDNALGLTDDPEFGLKLGQRLTPHTHGAMGFMAYSSPDLMTAMQAIQTFLPTRLSFAKLGIIEHGSKIHYALMFELPLSEAVERFLSESLATMFFAVAEAIVGRPLTEGCTDFSHPAPNYLSVYPRYLPGKIRFSAPQFSLAVPRAIGLEANASANHENYLLAMQQCETMLTDMQGQALNYRTRLKKLMLSHPPGTLSEENAAAELFVSKRTLARKLTDEGSSFRQIREQLLSQQAADYLRQSSLSVEAIAALLNYHDSANFRRAFKRWFGVSPSHFRQQGELPVAE